MIQKSNNKKNINASYTYMKHFNKKTFSNNIQASRWYEMYIYQKCI